MCDTEQDAAAQQQQHSANQAPGLTPGWNDGDKTNPFPPAIKLWLQARLPAPNPLHRHPGAPWALTADGSWLGCAGRVLRGRHRCHVPSSPGFPALPGMGLHCHTSHTAPGGFSWEATGSSFLFCHLFTFREGFPFVPPLM